MVSVTVTRHFNFSFAGMLHIFLYLTLRGELLDCPALVSSSVWPALTHMVRWYILHTISSRYLIRLMHTDGHKFNNTEWTLVHMTLYLLWEIIRMFIMAVKGWDSRTSSQLLLLLIDEDGNGSHHCYSSAHQCELLQCLPTTSNSQHCSWQNSMKNAFLQTSGNCYIMGTCKNACIFCTVGRHLS